MPPDKVPIRPVRTIAAPGSTTATPAIPSISRTAGSASHPSSAPLFSPGLPVTLVTSVSPTNRFCSHQASSATPISSSDSSDAPGRSMGQSASFFSIPTVSITRPARDPNAAGTPNSSIARVNASSIPAASAGESIGSVICQKARQALAP